jgi:hypothetical protein
VFYVKLHKQIFAIRVSFKLRFLRSAINLWRCFVRGRRRRCRRWHCAARSVTLQGVLPCR